ncbi:MAG: hypothetical protein HWE24_06440 [Oceanospirillaceae bacterium]|nr:hypothetical protein [Oceanospirillaceae bacterium]
MIQTFKLDSNFKRIINKYINLHLNDINPYSSEQIDAESLSRFMYETLESSIDEESQRLYRLIKLIQERPLFPVPTVHIKNIVEEPSNTLLPPRTPRGFDYGSNPHDRMKLHFNTEWVSWALALLLRHTNIIHPSEHGGKNRFHMVSPISDVDLRSVSASTGGGEFLQHNDATVYTSIKTLDELEEHLRKLGTSISMSANILGLSEDKFVSQVLCGKYSRVDATMLTGIVNKNTKTLITLPEMLQTYLTQKSFSKGDLKILAKTPIAHIAGPADGEISGYVGNITAPILMNESGDITGTCINLAPGRMVYVGDNEKEKSLFDRFCTNVRNCPNIEILVETSDILFFPNLAFSGQPNVTHGRQKIATESFNIEVDGVTLRRSLCRQYLVRNDPIILKEMNYGTC